MSLWHAIEAVSTEFLPLVTWWDVVDIAIVAYFIYRLLLIVKGTRSFQILFGLSILFLIFWFSDRFQLRTVRAFLSSIFDNLVIILLLLFQNDIRRTLSQFGRTSLLRSSEGMKDSALIEELVKSCVSLANKKIGALMVLERQADVLDFVESGTLIDSQFSKELVTSIFLPVSPLHDGAIVVRKGRVHMAGCFLPLTLNPTASKSIGTRHRAALGLTEETDALCIVVSEENATISLASGGRIIHNLDAVQLRKSLLESI